MDVQRLFDNVMRKYGFSFSLKKEQSEIIAHICANKNAFVVLPTGFGKSVTFLIPPLIFDEVLIIMPYSPPPPSLLPPPAPHPPSFSNFIFPPLA